MFHEYRDDVTALKLSDAHFAKVFEEHNELDDEITKAESGDIVRTLVEIDILKKKKLALKDEAYAMIIEYRKNK